MGQGHWGLLQDTWPETRGIGGSLGLKGPDTPRGTPREVCVWGEFRPLPFSTLWPSCLPMQQPDCSRLWARGCRRKEEKKTTRQRREEAGRAPPPSVRRMNDLAAPEAGPGPAAAAQESAFCPPVHLSFHPSVHPSSSVHPSFCLPVLPSFCPPVLPSTHPLIHPSSHPSVHLSFHPPKTPPGPPCSGHCAERVYLVGPLTCLQILGLLAFLHPSGQA